MIQEIQNLSFQPNQAEWKDQIRPQGNQSNGYDQNLEGSSQDIQIQNLNYQPLDQFSSVHVQATEPVKDLLKESQQIEDKPEEEKNQQKILEIPRQSFSQKKEYSLRKSLASLMSEHKLDFQIVQSVQYLSQTYDAYQPAGNDENSFYRAVGIAYLEYLIRKTTDQQELNEFVYKRSKALCTIQTREIVEYTTDINIAKVFREPLQSKKIEQSQRGFLVTRRRYNTEEIRCLFSMVFKNDNWSQNICYEQKVNQNLDQFIWNEVLQMGKEAKEITMSSLAKALNIVICTQCLAKDSQQQNKIVVYGDSYEGYHPPIYI